MEKCTCQDHHNNDDRQTIISLAKEIDYKNYKLLELEEKYDDTNALFRKVVVGLVESINSKEDNLMIMEQKLNEASLTIRHLERERDMQMNQYCRGNFLLLKCNSYCYKLLWSMKWFLSVHFLCLSLCGLHSKSCRSSYLSLHDIFNFLEFGLDVFLFF